MNLEGLMKGIDLVEESNLRWPDGWERTRIQDRKPQSAWKKPLSGYKDALIKELKVMGATSILISRSGNERMDPGVSVWFSMKKEDFSWQDALGIDSPAPTIEEVEEAFRKKAMNHHPDRGGDIEIFKKLGEHRKNARAWILGTHNQRHEYVVPCDKFNETRLNVAALRLAFAAFRSLESVGVPAILERTLDRAFKTALTAGSGGENGSNA
jgi:hypothetical protein